MNRQNKIEQIYAEKRVALEDIKIKYAKERVDVLQKIADKADELSAKAAELQREMRDLEHKGRANMTDEEKIRIADLELERRLTLDQYFNVRKFDRGRMIAELEYRQTQDKRELEYEYKTKIEEVMEYGCEDEDGEAEGLSDVVL